MKDKEKKLNEMKMEYKPLDKKTEELTDDELEQVTGGETIQERLLKALKGGG